MTSPATKTLIYPSTHKELSTLKNPCSSTVSTNVESVNQVVPILLPMHTKWESALMMFPLLVVKLVVVSKMLFKSMCLLRCTSTLLDLSHERAFLDAFSPTNSRSLELAWMRTAFFSEKSTTISLASSNLVGPPPIIRIVFESLIFLLSARKIYSN